MIVIKETNICFKTVLFLITLNFSILLFYLDYKVIGPEITFTLVYLIPIVFVTWMNGRNWGLFLSLICIIQWYLVKSGQHVIPGPDYLMIINLALKFSVYAFIVILLSKLKRLLEKEELSSQMDYLTEVLNRKGLHKILEVELNRARRSGKFLAVAYIDVDNFKSVNDKFGHHVGDNFLKGIAKRLAMNIRNTDHLARIGGDEFVLVLPDTSPDEAREVIGKLNSSIQPITGYGGLDVSFSIGLGIFVNTDIDADSMIRLTDKLMYEVKKSGKNAIVYREF